VFVDEGAKAERKRNGGEAMEGEVFLVAEELLGVGFARGKGKRGAALGGIGGGGAGWLKAMVAAIVEAEIGEVVGGIRRRMIGGGIANKFLALFQRDWGIRSKGFLLTLKLHVTHC
jgi:hypothetical protein